MRKQTITISFLATLCAVFICVFFTVIPSYADIDSNRVVLSSLTQDEIPEYTGDAIAVVHDNIPDFSPNEITTEPYVTMSNFDEIGRTGTGIACLGQETMPTEKRGKIGDIRPTGWHTVRYDDVIPDKFLYNRSHVIGYQLCGDNNTPENLFTGTRYLNAGSMLLFENQVADYLRSNPGKHVMYRVSPVYQGYNLVASGVQMEAYSVEDEGAGVCFNVFVYNVQPGVIIDYATGDSWSDPMYDPDQSKDAETVWSQIVSGTYTEQNNTSSDNAAAEEESTEIVSSPVPETSSYVLNTNTKKFHNPSCDSVNDMKPENMQFFDGTRDEVIGMGYVPCKRCNP